MAIEQLDYAAILADLEAKRYALDQTIASFRNAIALGALGQVGDIPPATNGITPSTFAPSVGSGEVPAGAFLGKSIPDAAKLYLEIVKKKQTSKEIADALLKGGMESNSKNFQQIVHSVLDRARKANSGIVKLDRSYWGLAGWYPASLRVNLATEKRTGRKKAARKPKLRGAAPVDATGFTAPFATAKGKANDRALEFLRGKPQAEHSLADVGAHLGMGPKGARLILGKLVKAGKIRMSAPGMYTVAPVQLSAAG